MSEIKVVEYIVKQNKIKKNKSKKNKINELISENEIKNKITNNDELDKIVCHKSEIWTHIFSTVKLYEPATILVGISKEIV